MVIEFPLVRQALEMMKEAGVRPNTYCMNSVMGVSVQARQPNTALEIFKEMEKDGIPRDVVSAYVQTMCRPPSASTRSTSATLCRHSVAWTYCWFVGCVSQKDSDQDVVVLLLLNVLCAICVEERSTGPRTGCTSR